MAVAATTTRTVAYNAVIASRMTKITTTEFRRSDVQRLRREATHAALVVPSSLGDGLHGHVFFTLGEDAYKEFTNTNIVYTDAPCPATTPDIEPDDTSGTIALKTAETAAALETFYVKEGVKAGI